MQDLATRLDRLWYRASPGGQKYKQNGTFRPRARGTSPPGASGSCVWMLDDRESHFLDRSVPLFSGSGIELGWAGQKVGPGRPDPGLEISGNLLESAGNLCIYKIKRVVVLARLLLNQHHPPEKIHLNRIRSILHPACCKRCAAKALGNERCASCGQGPSP